MADFDQITIELQADMKNLKEMLREFKDAISKRFDSTDKKIDHLQDRQEKTNKDIWELTSQLNVVAKDLSHTKQIVENTRKEAQLKIQKTTDELNNKGFSPWFRSNWWKVGPAIVVFGVIIEYLFKNIVNH